MTLLASRGGVASIGAMMSMQMFDQERAIDRPLLKRRVTFTGLAQAHLRVRRGRGTVGRNLLC